MRGKLKEKGNDIKKTLADITADTKLLKRQIVETASEGKEVFQELKTTCTIHFLTGSKIFLKTNDILSKRFWTFKIN